MAIEKKQDILTKKDEIIQEISLKMKCKIEDLEIMKHEAGFISIYWYAIYKHYKTGVNIPNNWLIG